MEPYAAVNYNYNSPYLIVSSIFSYPLPTTKGMGWSAENLFYWLSHRVHRVATAAFWRTFSDEGKIGPGW